MVEDYQDSTKTTPTDEAYSGSEYDTNPTQYGVNTGEYDTNATLYEEEESVEPIHGWLTFFLFVFVGLGSIISIIIDFTDYDFSIPAFITAGAIISDIAYLTTGAFTIVAFYKRHSDAVYLARIFITMGFIFNVSFLMLNENEIPQKELMSTVKSLFWCGIWFIYTFTSQQVKDRIPQETRRFKHRDWLLCGLMLIPMAAIVTYGQVILHQQEANAKQDAEMLALTTQTIGENQATDGRILITLPDGIECEKEITEDDILLFTLNNIANGTSANIISERDESINEMFDEIFEAWKPEDALPSNTTIINDNEYKKDGNIGWTKKIKIDVDVTVYWTFTIVCDGKSDKFFVYSTYSLEENDPVWDELIDNIAFL